MKMERKSRKPIIDVVAASARPKIDDSDVSQRGRLWWAFIMPGKVILWIAYMFPESFGSIFGSARRRNIPLLQVAYSIAFYAIVSVASIFILASLSRHR